MKKRGIGLIIVGLLAMPLNIKANVGNMTMEGLELNVGETKDVKVLVSKDIAAADGFVKSTDNSCLEIVNVKSDFGSGNYFASIDLEGNVLTSAATITVKGLKECSANIEIEDASIVSADGTKEDRGLSFKSQKISVIEEKQVEKEKTTTDETETETIELDSSVEMNKIKEKSEIKEDNKVTVNTKMEEKTVQNTKKTTKKTKHSSKKIFKMIKSKIINKINLKNLFK